MTFLYQVEEVQRRHITGWSKGEMRCIHGGGSVLIDGLEPPSGGDWVGEWCINMNIPGVDVCGWSRQRSKESRYRIWIRSWRGTERGLESNKMFESKLKDTPRCLLCDKKFSLGRRRYRCKVCFNAVCWECKGLLSVPGYQSEAAACLECCVRAGRQGIHKSVKMRFKDKISTVRSVVSFPNSIPPIVQIPSKISKSHGTLKIRLHECRHLNNPNAVIGVNPYVCFYTAGCFIRTLSRTRTPDPRWGEAEATFEIPILDPTASIFFCVYDLTMIQKFDIGEGDPIGRGAIHLTSLEPDDENNRWIELLPPTQVEIEGYQKRIPRLMRGCSTVSEKFGMQGDPSRVLGYIKLGATVCLNRDPLFGAFQPSYLSAETSTTSPEDIKGLDTTRDNAVRVGLCLGTPTLLSVVWNNPLLAVISCFVWLGISINFQLHALPYLITVATLLNGILSSFVDHTYDITLFEEDNTYKKSSIISKLGKASRAFNVAKKLEQPLGQLATLLSKLNSVLSFRDFYVSVIAITILLTGTVFSSWLLIFLGCFSFRVYFFLCGFLIIAVPPIRSFRAAMGIKKKPKAETGKRHALMTRAVNFYGRIPDDKELVHRQICDGQIRESANGANGGLG